MLEEARGLAESCWKDSETQHIEMNPVLVEAVAKRIAVWMETASGFSNDRDFYRDLVRECGLALGKEAFTADDGSVTEHPLVLKVPGLVRSLVQRVAEFIDGEGREEG